MQQKTRELLRTSEQQVAALKAQLAPASSSDAVTTTPATRAAALRAPLRGKQQNSVVKGQEHMCSVWTSCRSFRKCHTQAYTQFQFIVDGVDVGLIL